MQQFIATSKNNVVGYRLMFVYIIPAVYTKLKTLVLVPQYKSSISFSFCIRNPWVNRWMLSGHSTVSWTKSGIAKMAFLSTWVLFACLPVSIQHTIFGSWKATGWEWGWGVVRGCEGVYSRYICSNHPPPHILIDNIVGDSRLPH